MTRDTNLIQALKELQSLCHSHELFLFKDLPGTEEQVGMLAYGPFKRSSPSLTKLTNSGEDAALRWGESPMDIHPVVPLLVSTKA